MNKIPWISLIFLFPSTEISGMSPTCSNFFRIEFWELRGVRRQKMKLSMSSVQIRIVFLWKSCQKIFIWCSSSTFSEFSVLTMCPSLHSGANRVLTGYPARTSSGGITSATRLWWGLGDKDVNGRWQVSGGLCVSRNSPNAGYTAAHSLSRYAGHTLWSAGAFRAGWNLPKETTAIALPPNRRCQ